MNQETQSDTSTEQLPTFTEDQIQRITDQITYLEGLKSAIETASDFIGVITALILLDNFRDYKSFNSYHASLSLVAGYFLRTIAKISITGLVHADSIGKVLTKRRSHQTSTDNQSAS